MSNPSNRKKVVILGAGISGLTLAWYLKKFFKDTIEITIVEKNPYIGGFLQTKVIDNFLFETGPHTIRAKAIEGPAVLDLLQELGLNHELLLTDPCVKNRYLWLNDRLSKIPENPFSLILSPVTRTHLKTLFKESCVLPKTDEDESVYDFISRRLNAEIAETIIDPMMSGIYAGDIKKLSANACLPYLKGLEKKYGSIIKGFRKSKKEMTTNSPLLHKSKIFSFRNGLKSLPQAFLKKLKISYLLSTPVTSLDFSSDKVKVRTPEKVLDADYVFSTLSSQTLSPLLKPHNEKIATYLDQIPLHSIITINLGYPEKLPIKKGFGYLIPSKEQEDILGVIQSSNMLSEHNHFPNETRLSLMLGGAKRPDLLDYDDKELLLISANALNRHLGIKQHPNTSCITRHYHAIPQYLIGHHQRVELIENIQNTITPNLQLLGWSFYGVSIPACISKAREVASLFYNDFKSKQPVDQMPFC